MKSVRLWSIRQSRWLNFVYEGIEATLVLLNPLLKRIGYERLDKPFAAIERTVKGFLFDSQSCGQCTLGSTGMACPDELPENTAQWPLWWRAPRWRL